MPPGPVALLLRYLPVAADRSMTLIEHLEELRRRILYGVAGLAAVAVVGLWQEPRLLAWVMRPAGVTHLVALTVLEPLLVKFKIALIFALLIAFPWMLLQTLLFVSPALTEHEGRFVAPVTALSVLLGAAGVLFGYAVVMPLSTRWLLAQAGPVISVEVTALSYVSYAVWFLAAVALAFQTPLVVLALVGMGVLSRKRLRQEWRAVYMTITILAAVITPDWSPFTMLVVAGAMVGLYELSLLLARAIFPGR